MRAAFTRETGTTPTPDDERALLRREIDAELLYREALALRLDRNDRSIRWQLVKKMSFFEGVEASPDDDALDRMARDPGFDRDDPVIRRMLVEKVRLLARARQRGGRSVYRSASPLHRPTPGESAEEIRSRALHGVDYAILRPPRATPIGWRCASGDQRSPNANVRADLGAGG